MDRDRFPPAEDLSRFCSGVEQGLRDHGLEGVRGLLDWYERIRGALAAIPSGDLDGALVASARALDGLRLVLSRLERLADMKRALAGAAPAPARERV